MTTPFDNSLLLAATLPSKWDEACGYRMPSMAAISELYNRIGRDSRGIVFTDLFFGGDSDNALHADDRQTEFDTRLMEFFGRDALPSIEIITHHGTYARGNDKPRLQIVSKRSWMTGIGPLSKQMCDWLIRRLCHHEMVINAAMPQLYSDDLARWAQRARVTSRVNELHQLIAVKGWDGDTPVIDDKSRFVL